MAQTIYSDGVDLLLDRVQGNVTTDPPFSAAVILRNVNEAYADIYEASGGAYKSDGGSALWGAFSGGVALGSSGSAAIARLITLTYTDAGTAYPMDRMDLTAVLAIRASAAALGTYSRPTVYALIRAAMTAADTTTSRYDLYTNGSATVGNLTAYYRKEFIPMDGGASDVPDLNDVETRDMYLLAAARLAPLNGRAELVPSIVGDISMRTKEVLDRRALARQDANQD